MFEITHKRHNKLRAALARLVSSSRRWVSLDFFTDAEITALKKLAGAQIFRTAQVEIVHRENRVFQDFDVCFPAPRFGAFDDLASGLESGLYSAGSELAHNPFETRFQFDDFAIQRYSPGSKGIGIHRDGKRYKYIIVIITIAGQSRLFSTASRVGETRQRIDDRPGRLVLLTADGFAGLHGKNARPLHGVDCVRSGRLSIGFRSFG